MMTGGYTKETIASALEVLAGGDVTVKISPEDFEDSNMNKRFQSSMSLKSAVRGFEYFFKVTM
jgi:hypothetical protein